MDYSRAAGILIFVAAVQFFVGMLLAESFYPGYSVSQNYISDLGATCRPGGCIIQQPSASIFNLSVILLGLLSLVAAYSAGRGLGGLLVPILLAVTGIGGVGVGVFPETAGVLHRIFSLVIFLFGGLTAVSSYRLAKNGFRYFSVILGAAGLVALVLYISGTYLGLGPGGMERMIAYPLLLWATGFGAHLAAR